MILDIIICIVLVLILVSIIKIGKLLSFYGYVINQTVPTMVLWVHAIIDFIMMKLRQFFNFIKKILFRKKYTTISYDELVLETLSSKLEIIVGDR